MYIPLLKVYCSSFSAVAVCTFDWSMDNLLGTHKKNNSVCFLVQIDKEKRDTWKLQSKSKRWKVKYMAHENDMKITVWVCWCQNKHTYGIAQLVCIYTLLHFLRSWRDKLIVLWTLKRQTKIFLCICTFHISHF